ncbi:MAG: hypothetical protein JWM04_1141 [Verrucomicrobiales bacterium]|nr:hypothetical protein [Verrucomicrobiales bacterium]
MVCQIETHATPLTLSVDQVRELNTKLSQMRHEVNNKLSLLVAATEMLNYKPEISERMIEAVNAQPEKIKLVVQEFAREFDRAFSLTH